MTTKTKHKVNEEITDTEVAENITSVAVSNTTVKEIMKSEKIQAIIKEQMEISEEKGNALATFIEDNMKEVFKKGNETVAEVERLFDLVVDTAEIKAELDDIFSTYANSESDVVNKSLRNLDDELGQVAGPLRVMKSTLEEGSGIVRKLKNFVTGTSNSMIIQNSIQGIRGRVDSISQTLAKGKEQVEINQAILQRITPKIAMRIAKLKGMSTALNAVIKSDSELPDGTVKVISSLATQMDSLAANQLSDLQKLSVLVQVNVNNKLLLTTTEKKVVAKITSSILVNFVGGSESAIKDMAVSVDDALKKLDDNNTKQVNSLMNATEEEQMRVKNEMEQSLSNIEGLALNITEHNAKMKEYNKQIQEFLPEYRERIAKAEQGIYDTFDSSNEESAMILKALTLEAEEFTKEHASKDKD